MTQTTPPEFAGQARAWCESCSDWFGSRRAFTDHLKSDRHRANIGERPIRNFACSTCGKSFRRDADRKRHEVNLQCRLPMVHGHGVEQLIPAKRVADGFDPDPYLDSNTAKWMRGNRVLRDEHDEAYRAPDATAETVYLAMAEQEPANDVMLEQLPAEPVSYTIDCATNRSWNDSGNELTPGHIELQDVDSGVDLNESVHDVCDDTTTDQDFSLHDASSAQSSSEDFEMALSLPTSGMVNTTPETTIDDPSPSSQPVHEPDFPMLPPIPERVTTAEAQARHSFALPIRTRQSLELAGASRGAPKSKLRRRCRMCGKRMDASLLELLNHVREHIQAFQESYECDICEIEFTHQKDLDYHLQCAKKGYCGFNFKHQFRCHGHHPYCGRTAHHGRIDLLSDHDRFVMEYFLEDWKQSQLQAFISDNHRFGSMLGCRRSLDRWTLDDIRRSLSPSVRLSFSIKSLHSAPTDVDYNSKADIRDIESSLGRKEGRPASDIIRHNALVLAALVRHRSHEELFANEIEAGRAPKVQSLIQSGADVNKPIMRSVKKNLGSSILPLSLAAKHGCADVARTLLSAGARVNAMTQNHTTALHIAANRGHEAVVSVLLEFGADAEMTNTQDETAMHLAASRGHCSVVQTLVQDANASLDVPAWYKYTAIQFAASNRHEDMVELLLELGADVNSQNRYLQNALHMAAGEGALDIVNLLLTHNANPDAADATGETPLHKAICTDNAEVVHTLAARVSSLDPAFTNGQNYLGFALRRKCFNAAEALLQSDADPDGCLLDGTTLLEDAARRKCLQSIHFLLQFGASQDGLADDLQNTVQAYQECRNIDPPPLCEAVEEGVAGPFVVNLDSSVVHTRHAKLERRNRIPMEH